MTDDVQTLAAPKPATPFAKPATSQAPTSSVPTTPAPKPESKPEAKSESKSAPKPVPTKPVNKPTPVTPPPAPSVVPSSVTAQGNPPPAPVPTHPAPTTPAPSTPPRKNNVLGLHDKDSIVKGNKFMADVEGFAKQEATGLKSRTAFARRVCLAAEDKLIVEAQAATIYNHYQTAIASANNTSYEPGSSTPVQTSKLRAFIKLGNVAGESETLNPENGQPERVSDMLARAEEVRKNLSAHEGTRGRIKDKAFDFLLNIARAQLAAFEKPRQGANACDLLSNEDITSICLGEDKEPRAPKGESEKLIDVIKTLSAIVNGKAGTENSPAIPPSPSPELDNAIKSLSARLAKINPSAAEQLSKAPAGASGTTLAALLVKNSPARSKK